DFHQVTLAAAVVLIMRVYFRRTLDVLAIQRVLNLPFNLDGHSLVSLVADDAPNFAALQGFIGAHAAVPSLDFWLSTVLTRAMSLRTRRSSCGLLSWPVPFCMRRLNCSRNRPDSCSRNSFSLLAFNS